MSQPTPPTQVPSPDPDPLLEFSAEPDAEPATVAAASADDPAEPVVNAEVPAPPVSAAVASAPDPELQRRLDHAERMLEKAQVEISAIKSDVATLVTAIDDIKKRQSRPIKSPLPLLPAASPANQPPRLSRAAAAAVTAVGMILVLVVWGMWPLASYDMPELTTTEVQAAPEPDAPTPAPTAIADTPPVEIQKAAAVSVVEPVREPPPQPDRTNSVVRAAREPRSANTEYVGTLSIDASPAGEVFLNRKRVGRTPTRLEGLRAGSHLVWIEREGFQRWTRVVTVAANRVSRVSAELNPRQ